MLLNNSKVKDKPGRLSESQTGITKTWTHLGKTNSCDYLSFPYYCICKNNFILISYGFLRNYSSNLQRNPKES